MISLLCTPIYAAHPIPERQIASHDRFIKHIDMRERSFSIQITNEPNIAREAQVYNEEPQVLSFFPSGAGVRNRGVISIGNPDIILSSLKMNNGKYQLNLYNSTCEEKDAEVTLMKDNTKNSFALQHV